MDNIKFGYIRTFVLFNIIFVFYSVIFEGINKDTIDSLFFTFFTILFVLFILFLSSNKKGIYFNEKGIKCTNGKIAIVKDWKDVVIIKKIDFSYIKLMHLNAEWIKNKKYSILLCWLTEKSIIELTQKYVPQDHELYKTVAEYAEKRGLKL